MYYCQYSELGPKLTENVFGVRTSINAIRSLLIFRICHGAGKHFCIFHFYLFG